MSPTRTYCSRWPTACYTMLFMLASKATAVYGEIVTVSVGDKIQDALNDVQPGDTIEIEDGEYYEDIYTTISGTADKRITIRAVGGSDNKENVILRGAGESRVFIVNHEYYTIESFTIDGTNLEAEDDDDFTNVYRNKLLYVEGHEPRTMRDDGYLSAIDGLIVRDMIIKNAGGECIRLKYFVTYAEIYDNEVEHCGIYDFHFDDGDDGKNGEGIYIGTSTDKWAYNPTDEPDVCMGNVVRNNIIRTEGNEGVEIKEGGIDNIIEDNEIYMQLDAQSGGIGSRGDRTIIRNNRIVDASGAGVRLGGHEVEGLQYGINNEIYGNIMVDCMAYGIKIEATPQGQICGNDIEVPEDTDEDKYKFSGGSYAGDIDPTADCDSTPPTPSSPSSTTYPKPSVTSSTSPPTPSTSLTPSPTPLTSSSSSPAPSSTPSTDSSTPAERTPAPTENPDSEDFETSESADYEYVGCFANGPDRTTVAFNFQDSNGMTNKDCIDRCRHNGSRYAGTFRGDRCGCAYSTSRISRNGESTECVVPCSGDDSDECGGFEAVSTWKI